MIVLLAAWITVDAPFWVKVAEPETTSCPVGAAKAAAARTATHAAVNRTRATPPFQVPARCPWFILDAPTKDSRSSRLVMQVSTVLAVSLVTAVLLALFMCVMGLSVPGSGR